MSAHVIVVCVYITKIIIIIYAMEKTTCESSFVLFDLESHRHCYYQPTCANNNVRFVDKIK